jgi:hypothetical protein
VTQTPTGPKSFVELSLTGQLRAAFPAFGYCPSEVARTHIFYLSMVSTTRKRARPLII